MKRQVKAPVATPMAAASGRAPRRPIGEIWERKGDREREREKRGHKGKMGGGVHEKVTDLIGTTMSLSNTRNQ